ncbi:hypothetical protein SKAU_G00023410 [Synaphobranchus kaupii]|uniref:Uncharacterized protein n=1 Tax=Synaphobranchus kaupii TaxID=118154 RepID=A0A9Q1GD94_SYNKA|nr:hypothetical protein SKAU_G00023410 [Synaphobranchus kaupii]
MNNLKLQQPGDGRRNARDKSRTTRPLSLWIQSFIFQRQVTCKVKGMMVSAAGLFSFLSDGKPLSGVINAKTSVGRGQVKGSWEGFVLPLPAWDNPKKQAEGENRNK